MPFQERYVTKIIDLLKKSPKGMTTDGIARNLPLNRTSTAKYLNTLVISGQVEVQKLGPAKIFTLTRRVPVSQMLSVFPEAVIIVDQDHIIRESNSRFLTIGHVNRDEITGKKFETIALPEDLKVSLMPMITHPLSMQEPCIISTVNARHRKVHIRVTCVAVVFDDSTPGSALILEEVPVPGHGRTQKNGKSRKTKASLRDDCPECPVSGITFRKEQYRRIFEDLPVAFYRSDLEGNIVTANPAAARMAGYVSPGEVVGCMTTAEAYADPGDRELFLAELARDGKVINYPVTIRSVDGDLRYVTTSSWYCSDMQGNVVGIEGILHDITELRQREAALQERMERARSLIGQANCIVYSVNSGGILTCVSPNITMILGYETGDVIGRPFETFLHPDDIPGVRACIQHLCTAIHDPAGKEFRVQHKNGTWAWFTANASVIRNERGDLISFDGIAQDITTIKKAGIALLQANRQIVLLNSITRHDIVNRITVIRGYIGIVKMKFMDPGLLDLLKKIESGIEMIRSQIEFTKTYQDLGTRPPQWQDVAAVLPSSQVPATITLTTEITGIEVYADGVLAKVFFNLLDNTLRHGGNVTEIHILARCSGPGLTIVWADNGVGIPAEEKERIFEQGYGKNTGLGLFFVREILALTGITIAEIGEPGNGARFEIAVPQGMWRKGPSAAVNE